MTKEIRLSQGQVAIVDDEWFEELSKYKWFAYKHGYTWYAGRNQKEAEGGKGTIRMHTMIVGTPDGFQVDHIDGNGLNNRLSNLRVCTRFENYRNRRSYGGSSKYKGVSWRKEAKKWTAAIRLDGRSKHLGYFADEAEAARAYDRAARNTHGEYARLNFPLPHEQPAITDEQSDTMRYAPA